jgi:outer membrane autotransporter protein
VNHNFLSAYGSYSPDNWYLDVSVIAGFTHTSNRQHIKFLTNTPFAVDRNATSDNNGFELTPHVGAGYDIPYKDAVLTPFVNVDYSYIHDGKFVTSGAQSLDQNVQSSYAMLLRSELGLKVSDKIPVETSMARGEFTPDLTLSFVDKRSLRKGHVKAGFVNQPGYYLVNYFTRTREEVSLGIGATLQMNNGGFIVARFNSEFGMKYHSNEVTLKLGYAF